MQAELVFLVTSLVLLVAGTKLARYGEAIAEKTQLSVTWVGLFLVAAVTSLPELFAGLSSILLVGEPDLAAGDVLGSCLVNLTFAAFAGFVAYRTVTRENDHDLYRMGSAYLTVMLLLVGGGIALHAYFGVTRILGLLSGLVVIAYIIAIRHIFGLQVRPEHVPESLGKFGALTARRVVTMYAVNGVIVVAAAMVLPALAQEIAIEQGLGTSFVGTSLLAVSTSLPELVVVIAALRQGAPGLALGGLVGSNLFDLVILAIDDLFYVQGSILAALDISHLVTIGFILGATWLFVLGMPAERVPRRSVLAAVLLAYASALLVAARASGHA